MEDEQDIWVHELATDTRQRLTFPGARDTRDREEDIIWISDGRTVIYAMESDVQFQLFALASDGSGSPQAIFEGGMQPSISPDGRHLIYALHGQDGSNELWIAEPGPDGDFDGATPRRFHENELDERSPSISPDGRYVAYLAGDGMEGEIYLSRFPGGEGRWQVSIGGGRVPRWAPDGAHLYFVDDEGVFYEVSVDLESGVRLGEPQALFNAPEKNLQFMWGNYAVSKDGLFLVSQELPEEIDRVRSIVVVGR